MNANAFVLYKRKKKLNVSPEFDKVLMLLSLVANPILYRYFHDFILIEGAF